MATIVHEYVIELQLYHDEIVGRLKYEGGESSLYSLGELTNIIALWQENKLQGSFGIGTILSLNATFQLLEK